MIQTIDDPVKVINRLEKRGETEKDDKSIFEHLDFQAKLKPLFEDSDLRNAFTSRGTIVAYLNAGISVEHSRREAIQIYKSFLETGKIPDKYLTPKSALL